MEQEGVKKSKSTKISILAMILSIVAISITSFLYYRVNDLDNRLREIGKLQLETWIGIRSDLNKTRNISVDFTVPNAQDIGKDFKVANLSVEQHLTGVKIKGRVINATSLRHDNLKFKITIAEKEKDFWINRISSGNSTTFDVYVPDVPLDKAQYGTIEYLESTVSFYTR
jgi:hypothetical protein